jgi:hypothetical protein
MHYNPILSVLTNLLVLDHALNVVVNNHSKNPEVAFIK